MMTDPTSPLPSPDPAPSCCAWRPVKRPSGTSYDVATDNGIRCTPWPVTKLCHARVLAMLMNGVPDDIDPCSEHGKITILRVHATTKAFYRWEAVDRSRNVPEAVAAWNAYVDRTHVMASPTGAVSAMDVGSAMLGWTDLPGILAKVVTS